MTREYLLHHGEDVLRDGIGRKSARRRQEPRPLLAEALPVLGVEVPLAAAGRAIGLEHSHRDDAGIRQPHLEAVFVLRDRDRTGQGWGMVVGGDRHRAALAEREGGRAERA